MTTTGEQLRALALASLMVLSVVAMGVSIAGTAAATHGEDDVLIVDGVGSGSTHYETIQGAIDNASEDDTVSVLNGTYELDSRLDGFQSGMRLVGESEEGVVIDGGSLPDEAWTVYVEAGTHDVHLSQFTVENGPYDGVKANYVTGLEIADVTVVGSERSEFDLNNVRDVTLDDVTADGDETGGVGIALSGVVDATISNANTVDNDWGGIGLWDVNPDNEDSSPGEWEFIESTANVTVEDSELSENVPLYSDQDYNGTLGDLYADDFAYAIENPDHRESRNGRGEDFVYFQETRADAIAFAVGLENNESSTVRTLATDSEGEIDLGETLVVDDGMSIQTAVTDASAGDTIEVVDGTFALDDTLTIDESVAIIGENDPEILSNVGSAAQPMIKISADDVTLESLTIRQNNSDKFDGDHGDFGDGNIVTEILVDDAVTGTRILDNTLVRESDTGGHPSIHLGSTTGPGGNDDTVIEGNNLSKAYSIAGFVSEGESITVHDNTIEEHASIYFHGETFGEIEDPSGLSVEDNTGPTGNELIILQPDERLNGLFTAGQSINGSAAAATEGTTIEVPAGTYAEDVDLRKSITITATDGPDETTIEGMVNFHADDATLDGFTVDNGGGQRAIAPRDTDGATISNVVVVNSFRAIQGDWHGRPTGLTVTESTFHTDYGIAGTEEVTDLVIDGNTFNTTTEAIGIGEGAGIESISENRFSSDGARLLDYRDDPNTTIDATENFWGSADGPSDDQINDTVDVDPWYEDASLTTLSDEEEEDDDSGPSITVPSDDDDEEEQQETPTPTDDQPPEGDVESQVTEEIADEDPDTPGTTVQFDDEESSVDEITFADEGDEATGDGGSVTVSEYSEVPEEASETDDGGDVVHAVDIDVPEAHEDSSATVTMSVDRSALGDVPAEDAQIAHRTDDGEWVVLDTEVVSDDGDAVTFSAETDGFSLFGIVLQTGPATATPGGDTPAPAATATPAAATAQPTDDPVEEPAGFDLATIGVVVALVLVVIGLFALARRRS